MENIKIYIVIPAYNEATIIQNVIAEIKNTGYENIIVIDDGSFDNTYEKAGEIENITVLRHKINRGKGAAAKTGIEAAKLLGADIIVTMDSDGQHDPKNIENLVDPIINEKFDAVLGTRLINPKGMPLHKILHNKIANLITWYLYGLWVTDSQSGFRAYSKNAFNAINTRTDNYAYDSEVIREIYNHKLKYKEVPISVRYTEYSMGKSQKQSFVNGLKTAYKMIWRVIG
ncbi:glycosyltransferase family 2 protein [bacterium]|nr:glycosyltransferase family 2 protein [bacterium]